MGTCIRCGAETKNGYKICIPCYDLARHNPCHMCTADTGRHEACHDTCQRRKAWRACHDAVREIQRDKQIREAKTFRK